MSEHPYGNTEELPQNIKVRTFVEYIHGIEDKRGCMAGYFVVSVERDQMEIGNGYTEDFTDIGTWLNYEFHAPDGADDIKAAIQTARDEAMNEARDWLKAEIEAIQSGQREAELFAAVTALNTPAPKKPTYDGFPIAALVTASPEMQKLGYALQVIREDGVDFHIKANDPKLNN